MSTTMVAAAFCSLGATTGATADSTTVQPASTPFAFADFSWVPGNAGASERPLTFGPFTGEFRMDDVYHYSNHRSANVPYFAGRGGVTPPGGNQGPAGSTVTGWAPDLVRDENRLSAALLVKM